MALQFSKTGRPAVCCGEKCLQLSPIHLSTFYFSLCDFYLGHVPAATLFTAKSHITGVSSHDFLFVYHILASSSHFAAFCLDPVRGKKHLCCTAECQVHPKTDEAPPFHIQCSTGHFGEKLHRVETRGGGLFLFLLGSWYHIRKYHKTKYIKTCFVYIHVNISIYIWRFCFRQYCCNLRYTGQNITSVTVLICFPTLLYCLF